MTTRAAGRWPGFAGRAIAAGGVAGWTGAAMTGCDAVAACGAGAVTADARVGCAGAAVMTGGSACSTPSLRGCVNHQAVVAPPARTKATPAAMSGVRDGRLDSRRTDGTKTGASAAGDGAGLGGGDARAAGCGDGRAAGCGDCAKGFAAGAGCAAGAGATALAVGWGRFGAGPKAGRTAETGDIEGRPGTGARA